MNAASVLGIGLVFTLKDEVSNAASKMTQKFKQLDYVSSETAAKMESSLKGIGTGFKMMGAGAALLAPLGLAVSKSMEFNKAVSAVGAVSNASAEDMLRFKEQAMALGESTEFTAKQVAEGQKFLAMAGFGLDTIDAMPAMLSLASAGGLELSRTADIASNAMSIFGIETKDAGKAADILASASTSSNTTIESLGESIKYFAGSIKTYKIPMSEATAAIGLMGNAGLQGSVATTALSTAMSRFAKPSAEMKKTFDEMGISMFDAKGEFVGLPNMILQITKAQEKMTPEMRAGMNSTIFGAMAVKNGVSLMDATYKDANGTVLKGAAAMETYAATLENSKGAAKRMADMQMNNLAGSFTKLQSATDGFLIRIGDKLEPLVKKVVDRLISMVSVMTKIANSPFGTFLVGLTATLGVTLVALGGFVSTFHAARFAMAATQPVLILAKTNFAALKGLFQAMQSITPAVFASIKTGFASMRVAAMSALTPLLPYLIPIGIAVALISVTVYGLVKAYQSFQKVLDGGGAETGFLGFLQKVGSAIHSVITIWKSATNEGFTLSGQFYEALQRIGMEKFALSLGTWIVRVKAFFGGIVERAVNFGDVLGSVWSSFERVGSSLGNAFSAVGKAFTSIISLVVKPFEPLLEMFPEISFYLEKLGGDVEWFAIAGKVAFELLIFPIRAIAIGLELVANVITFVVDGIAIFYNFFASTFDSINWYIDMFKSGMISLPKLFSLVGNAITHNLLEGIKAGWSSITSFLVNSLKALPGGEAVASYFGIGGETAEGKAKQAAINQTGLAGSGISDTEVAPSQASSSFSKKVDNINNASVTKAQQTRETSVAMKELSSAGLQNNISSPSINVKPSDVIINLDGREIASAMQSERDLDDARS